VIGASSSAVDQTATAIVAVSSALFETATAIVAGSSSRDQTATTIVAAEFPDEAAATSGATPPSIRMPAGFSRTWAACAAINHEQRPQKKHRGGCAASLRAERPAKEVWHARFMKVEPAPGSENPGAGSVSISNDSSAA
jgi:hypothetical protein